MIAGFNHDDKSDGSGKAGITFVFTDSVGKQFMYSESDLQILRNDVASGKTYDIGWKNTSMRKWPGDSFMFELLSDLSKEIVSVDKKSAYARLKQGKYWAGGDRTVPGIFTDQAEVVSETTSGKLWIPSFAEIARQEELSSRENYALEGEQYQVYSDTGVNEGKANSIFGGGSSASDYSSSYDGNSGWWLRSYTTYAEGYLEEYVPTFNATGDDIEGGTGTLGYRNDFQPYAHSEESGPFVGVVPAFCI